MENASPLETTEVAMSSPSEDLLDRVRVLEAKVRLHQKLATLSVFVVIVLAVVALQPAPQKPRFAEIDVERINVIEPDGRLALVIANTDRLPDPIVRGREIATERTGPGMLFFNGKGDECGGLTYKSVERDGDHEAFAHFSFDQYENDQVVFLSYRDDGNERSSGLHVIDRPTKPSIFDLVALRESIERATGEEKEKLLKQMKESAERGELGAQRVFVGSAGGTALVGLKDATGHDRIRMYVDRAGAARLEFLDEKGNAVFTLPH